MRILVLGAGLVGGPMAVDLAGDERFEVTAVDVSDGALARLQDHPRIRTARRDLSDPDAVTGLAADHDLVISAVPGALGHATLEAVLHAGRNVVDIAFFPEDPFTLDELAVERGVTAVVDCGVAPGMSNLLVGHVDWLLDETESVLIYVGGLPEERTWPFEYKAGFSPADVIEVYLRPARYVENGALVVRPALSDPEIIDFPPLGSLEAFNTDGLRTLLSTIDAPSMREKTLRYPGHVEHVGALRAAGFFDREPVELDGARVRPFDLTSHLLRRSWQLQDDDVDLTVMRVLVEGRRGERRVRHTYELLDRFDETTGVHSMARTTGYTATMVARLLAEGRFEQAGVVAPEHLGRNPDCVDFVLRGLAERGVVCDAQVEELSGPTPGVPALSA